MARIRFCFALVMMVALAATAGTSALAQNTCIKYNTTLESLTLTGGPFPIPLASDPTNALDDSIQGYGFVNSLVTVSLSASPATTGMAFAFQEGGGQAANAIAMHEAAQAQQNSDFGQDDGGQGAASTGVGIPCGDDVIDPDELDGQQFIVDSFFDVFFDITVTDVDPAPGRDYAGQPDGASISLTGNGPASMQSFAFVFFDADAPNFGLIPPPEADPYIGHFDIVIPLGADINGNAATAPECASDPAQCDDKIVFTLATHSAGDENRTFIVLPNGTVLEEFDSAAFLEGAVIDTFADPPFSIGAQLPNGLPDPAAFGGPTTASSTLVNPTVGPPIPSMNTWGLAALGILLLSFVAWRLGRTRQAQA